MTPKKFTITVYTDPGHSWGKLKRDVLYSLNVAHLISEYSYQYGDNVYLEEDCDLPIVMAALESTGAAIVFREKHSNTESKIRSYERYSF